MKNNSFLPLVFLISMTLIHRFSSRNFEPGAEAQITYTKHTFSASSIDGAWQLVYLKRNDTLTDVINNPQLKMFSDGIFSIIAQDSSGKIRAAAYGKFELQGTSYKETFIYHSTPRFVGGIAWQEYEVRGDTLYAKGFSKMIVGGKEVANPPRIEEKRVRVK